MSKENAQRFLDELAGSEKMQKELDELKPKTVEELISYAEKSKICFSREELKEILAEIGAIQLSDEELETVSAGAFPTAVNSQITDSVTQANVKVLGDAPAIAMGNLFQATAQALSNAAHNATAAQQQAGITAQAATTMGVATLYSLDTASAGVAAKDIFK